jgi:glycerol-3-phosphate acyltransferase PlsY
VTIALALVVGYLIGGIPTGIWICRAVAGVDPRTLGSGSSGATNVSRTIGKKWAIVVLLLDVLKGFLPVFFLAPLFGPEEQVELTRVAMALGTVAGHVWTPYASFHGGKGIATAAGAMLALDTLATLVALAIWVLIYVLFRRVSLASLAGAITVPIAVLLLGDRPPELLAASIVLTLFLIFTHRENIQRLLSGRERPIA